MIISFMVLGNDPIFKDKLMKLIERQLTEAAGIDCKILTAKSVDEALRTVSVINIDVHVVMELDEKSAIHDYLVEVAQKYPNSPVIPVVVIGSEIDANDKVKIFNEFKIIGYIDQLDKNEIILADLRKAVTFVQMLDDRKVTFKRPAFSQVYNEQDIYCVQRLPNGQKRINVTARVSDEVTQEEFTIKSNLAEIRQMFGNENTLIRCHQSWLVNPKLIMKVDGINDLLILVDEVKVPFGRTYLDNLAPFI